MHIVGTSFFTCNYLIINNIYNIYSIGDELEGTF